MKPQLLSILLLLGFIFPTGILLGQSGWEKKGNSALESGNYIEAMEYFNWALKKDTTAIAASGMAMCHYRLREFVASEKYFKIAERHGGLVPKFGKYYARSLWANGKLDAAEEWLVKAEPDIAYRPKMVVAALQKDSSISKVRQITFSKTISEFSPQIIEGGLLITATRNNAMVVHKNPSDDRQTTGIFFMQQIDSLNWRPAKRFNYVSNPKHNEGPASLSSDEFVYSSSAKSKGRELSLFSQKHENGKTNRPYMLDFNIAGASSQHPSLSADGNTLYFSSNRRGGKGGFDIWKSKRVNGEWQMPSNVRGVNSSDDELFPFISPDGTLYFSTDARAGIGGLDIYKAAPLSTGQFAISNLGFPINSSADDFGICTYPDGKRGYFSSNRGSNGSDDNIFEFKKDIPQFECQPQKEPNYCFVFSETNELGLDLGDAPIRREWDFGDGTTSLGDTVRHCFPGVGSYTVQLNLVDTVLAFVFMNEAEYVVNIDPIEQAYINAQDSVQLGKMIQLDANQSYLPDFQIQEYFWNTGEGWENGTDVKEFKAKQLGTQVVQLGLTLKGPTGKKVEPRCTELGIEVVDHPVVLIEEPQMAPVAKTEVVIAALPEEDIEKIKKEIASSPLPNYDIADSAHHFSVQLLQSETPIDTNELVRKGFSPVKVVFAKGLYNYLVGNESEIERIFPSFRSALEKGFDDALVIAIVEGRIISGNDSTLYLRLPVGADTVSVRLVEGKILDVNGQPLNAIVTWQDLVSGAMIDTVHSKSADGSFFVKLRDGQLYGYSVESEGFFPVSNFLDLRDPKIANGTDIINLKTMPLQTVQEVRDEGETIRLNNVFFDFNSAILRRESYPELRRFIKVLEAYPASRFEIMGHTDDVGKDKYNNWLSLRRANSILTFLNQRGVDVSRVTANGYGESMPAVPNTNAKNRQFNRRVEFRFVKDGE